VYLINPHKAGQIHHDSQNKGVARAVVQRTRCSIVNPLAHLLFHQGNPYAPFHSDERSYLMRTVFFVAFECHPHPEASQGGIRDAAVRGLKLPGWVSSTRPKTALMLVAHCIGYRPDLNRKVKHRGQVSRLGSL